jgi:hypothetical protein
LLVVELFEQDEQHHELAAEGHAAVVFTTELTCLQRKVLCLLGMPGAYCG